MGYQIKPWPYYVLYAVAALGGAASLWLMLTAFLGTASEPGRFMLGAQGAFGSLLVAGLAAVIGLLTEIRDRR